MDSFEDKKKNVFTNTFAVILFAIICNGLWGSAFPGIKLGYQYFNTGKTGDVLLFAGIRFMIAGVFVIAFNSIRNKSFVAPQNISDWRRVVSLCMFQTVLQYVFFYIGVNNTTGVKASIVEGSNVFIAIVVAALIPIKMTSEEGSRYKREKLSVRIMLGCLIGFAGVFIVNFNPHDLGGGFCFMGEGMVLLSTVAYAFSTVLIKKYAMESDTIMLSGWQFLTGGAIITVIGILSDGKLSPSANDMPKALFMLIYLACVSAIAYTLWGVLLKYNPVSKIAVTSFSNPIFGVILSSLLLDESDNLDYRCIIALALVCIGIYLVNSVKEKIYK